MASDGFADRRASLGADALEFLAKDDLPLLPVFFSMREPR
jgi:hypothetical protein